MVLASSRALEFSPFSLGPESLSLDSFSLRYLPPPWAGLAMERHLGHLGAWFFYNGNGIWDFFGAENKNRSQNPVIIIFTMWQWNVQNDDVRAESVQLSTQSLSESTVCPTSAMSTSQRGSVLLSSADCLLTGNIE